MHWTGEVATPCSYSGEWLVCAVMAWETRDTTSPSAPKLTLARCKTEEQANALHALISSNVETCRPLVELAVDRVADLGRLSELNRADEED